jgi:hypothetical protein
VGPSGSNCNYAEGRSDEDRLAILILNSRTKMDPFYLVIPHEPNLRFTSHIIIPNNAEVRPRKTLRIEVSRADDAEGRSDETILAIFILNSRTTSDSFSIHKPKLRFTSRIVMPDYPVDVRRHDAEGRSDEDILAMFILNGPTTSDSVPILVVCVIHKPKLSFASSIVMPDDGGGRLEVSLPYDAEGRSDEDILAIFILNSRTTSDSDCVHIHEPNLCFVSSIVMPDDVTVVRPNDAEGRFDEDILAIFILESHVDECCSRS